MAKVWILVGAMVGTLGAGCFPPLPAEDDVDSGALDTAGADGAIEDSAEGGDSATLDDTSEVPDTSQGDTAEHDTVEPDTAVADTAIDDTAVSDTAVEDTATDTSAVDTADSDTSEVHPCPTACPASTTACKVNQCDTSTGTCAEVDASDGTPCDDGLVCTISDKCIGGLCLSAQNPCDDGIACTADSCDEDLGGCVNDDGACPCAPGRPCGDGNPCNGEETCDLSTYSCVTGTPPAENVPCDDHLVCTDDDRCRNQECKGLTRDCSDGLPCSVDSCSEEQGGCVWDTTACVCTDDSGCPTDTNLCDGETFCDVSANACDPGTPVTCEPPANACKRSACVALTGTCAVLDRDDGTECDDGDVCTTTDTCQSGVCTGFSPVTCTPSNTCQVAVGCDPSLGCLEAPKADGTPCTTTAEEQGACRSGSCRRLPTVFAGPRQTCAILADNDLKCWGANSSGELGQGNLDDNGGSPTTPFSVRDIPTVLGSVVSVSLGSGFTCAVNTDGETRCWGDNANEKLGYGDAIPRGGTPETVPSVLSPLPVGVPALAIVTQDTRSCVRTTSNGVRCWGEGNDHVMLETSTIGTEWGPSIAQAGDVAVDASREVASIVNTSFGSSCVLFTDHRIRCWGSSGPVVGYPTTTTYGYTDPVADAPIVNPGWEAKMITGGTGYVCALSMAGSVYCWGYGSFHELGTGDTADRETPALITSPEPFLEISAGGNHTCGVTASGGVHCWGGDAYGQCGYGSSEDVPNIPSDAVAIGGAVAHVAAGWGYTCAVLRDGEVRCWGINDARQLGISGSAQPYAIGDEPAEMPPPAVDLE